MPVCTIIAPNIFTIDGFMTEAECDAEIRHAESIGFDEATINTYDGAKIEKKVRNNDRVISDDHARAQWLWERALPHIVTPFKERWDAIRLNERLRYYRYDPGMQFDWHRDAHENFSPEERSYFTFMVYLNDDFEGGATSFEEDDPRYKDLGLFQVKPKKGMALMFHHPIRHRGDNLISGRKYVLRSDVVYKGNKTLGTKNF